MKVNVRNTLGGGESFELDVDPKDRVSKLVQDAAQIVAAEASNLSLALDGTVLPGDRTVKNCGIKEGSTLLLMPRDPQGGSSNAGFPPLLPGLRRQARDRHNQVRAQRLAREESQLQRQGIPIRRSGPNKYIGSVTVSKGRWAGQPVGFSITIPEGYPSQAPHVEVTRQPRLPHPNISPSGWVCLNILDQGWTPSRTMASIHHALAWLLQNPNYDSPNNLAAMQHRPLFDTPLRGPGAVGSFVRRHLRD